MTRLCQTLPIPRCATNSHRQTQRYACLNLLFCDIGIEHAADIRTGPKPIHDKTRTAGTRQGHYRNRAAIHHGAGDTLAAATACALAHGCAMPDAVAFGKEWVTECLRAAYPLGAGHGPVSALFRLQE